MTQRELLIALIYKIEAISNTTAALESAALSPKYAGRQLTSEQMQDLRSQAKAAQNDGFAGLHAAVVALLPETLPTPDSK